MKKNSYYSEFSLPHYSETFSRIDREEWMEKFTNYLYSIDFIKTKNQERSPEEINILLELVMIALKENLYATADRIDDVFQIWERHIADIDIDNRMSFAKAIPLEGQLQIKSLFIKLYELDFTASGFFQEFKMEIQLINLKTVEVLIG